MHRFRQKTQRERDGAAFAERELLEWVDRQPNRRRKTKQRGKNQRGEFSRSRRLFLFE